MITVIKLSRQDGCIFKEVLDYDDATTEAILELSVRLLIRHSFGDGDTLTVRTLRDEE